MSGAGLNKDRIKKKNGKETRIPNVVDARVTCTGRGGADGPRPLFGTQLIQQWKNRNKRHETKNYPSEKNGDGCPKVLVSAGTMWQPDFSDRRQHFPTQVNLESGALGVEEETSAILIDRI